MATRTHFFVYNPDGTEAHNGNFLEAPLSLFLNSNAIEVYNQADMMIGLISLNVDDVVRYKIIYETEIYYEVGETVEFPNNQDTTCYIYAEQAEQPSITDLTNTTWNVGSGWTATAGYGKFGVNGAIKVPDNLGDEFFSVDTFNVGYATNSQANTIRVNIINDPMFEGDYDLYNSYTFTLTIAGGTDVTNTSLISWLEANGELQEEPSTDTVTITYGDRTITLSAGQKCTFKGGKVMQADIVATVSASEETEDELQGTWVFNDSVTVDAAQSVSYSFEFTSKNTAFIKLSTQIDGRIFYFTTDSSSITVMNDYGIWNDNDYKTINITSKLSEVTDSDALLTWLKGNATKQGEVVVSYNITVNNTTTWSANSDNPTQIKKGETVTLTFKSDEVNSPLATATNAVCAYTTTNEGRYRIFTVTLSNATSDVVVTIDYQEDPEPV